MNLKRLLMELRAEHARLQRAIEQLERLYGLPSLGQGPRIAVKRLGRPRKKENTKI